MNVDVHSYFFTTSFLYAIVTYLILGAIGGFAKEMYGLVIGKSDKLNWGKVMISSLTASMVLVAFENLILEKLGPQWLFLTSIIVGMVGVELFGRLSTINGIFRLLSEARKLRDAQEAKEREGPNDG